MQAIEGSSPYLSSPTACRLSESDPADESRKKISMPERFTEEAGVDTRHDPVCGEYMLANECAGVVRDFPLDPEVDEKYLIPAS